MGIAGFIVALGVGVALRAVLHLRSQRSHLPRRRQVPDADQVWQHQAGVTRYRVGELPDGEIGRVEGTVGEQARTLRGPLSGRACVYYMVLVEAGGAIQWTEGDGVAFALEDASGRAIIDPALARIALSLDHREPLRALREATPQQDAVLARHGYNVTGAGQLVFYEAVASPRPRRSGTSGLRRRCSCAWRAGMRSCRSRAIARDELGAARFRTRADFTTDSSDGRRDGAACRGAERRAPDVAMCG
jgi:hypothetical protein